MKTILKLLLLICLVGPVANSQESRINFEMQPRWKDILKKAQKENKPIFVDAYTTWCGPCKIMDRDVFTDEKVVAYFNDKYINVKMDMEKGQGIDLKDDWKVSAFPTLLYFDSKGEITHRVVGAYDAADFLEYSKMALDKDRMALNLQKRYDAGERGGEFMYNYLLTLKLAYYDELEKQVATDYFASLDLKELLEPSQWAAIKEFMKDPSSSQFQYLLSHIDTLRTLHEPEEVNAKFYNTIDKQIQSWFYWPDKLPFETAKEDQLIGFLQAIDYDRAPELLSKLLINRYNRLGNNKQYLAAVDHSIAFNLIPSSGTIVNHANRVLKTFSEDDALKKAVQWLEVAERKETQIEHKAAIYMAKSDVLKKMGYHKEAERAKAMAKKADEKAEAEGKKIESMPAMKMIKME